ncbi:hypothetical protein MmTuc01_0985 [Methanosarcina mazei Tuc01]|uniref:Uncharacterized protein n=1 Tax=Methanosarcina mazei Tuc01 TaxID=1236903 RepID=M1QHE8_METMZ|nr:hypothetical protein MmTuc01_0985 [Methanosarcina mazei Tuc01]
MKEKIPEIMTNNRGLKKTQVFKKNLIKIRKKMLLPGTY